MLRGPRGIGDGTKSGEEVIYQCISHSGCGDDASRPEPVGSGRMLDRSTQHCILLERV